MKRTARQIREDAMKHVKENYVEKPKTRNVPAFEIWPTTHKNHVKGKKVAHGQCCVERYGDNLPTSFRKCIDCPLTQ